MAWEPSDMKGCRGMIFAAAFTAVGIFVFLVWKILT